MKKKNALLGIALACMLSMTACGNKVEDYSDKKKTTEAVTEATTEASTEAKTEEEPATSDMNSPFYGVWVYVSKDKADADNFAANVNGMTSLVFLTTDWSNLNTEPYYVVSLGMYTTEDDANGALETAKDLGYSDAYVKYSGEHN
ncbi:MAG: SPOR domain-containing protein [Eubacterium sp.]|nr:SPOR domain-containing protein [Eubacterium sp.]